MAQGEPLERETGAPAAMLTRRAGVAGRRPGAARRPLVPPRRARALLVIAALVALEAGTRAGVIPGTIAVPPSAMFATLWELIASGTILPHLGRSLLEILAALGIAFPAGLVLGLVFWRWPAVGSSVEPFLIAVLAVPLVLFYPFLLVFLGIGAAPIIVIAAAMGTVPVAANVWVGLRELRPIYLRVGRSLNATRSQALFKIIFPGAAPMWFAGAKLGLIYCFIGVVSSEFITAPAGLGYLIAFYFNEFLMAEMYAGVLLVVLLALLFGGLLAAVERRLAKA